LKAIMSKAMTFPQFYSLMKYIAENNGPYGSN